MRFEWTFWDFAREYLLKVVGLWIVIFSAVSGVVYLVTEFGLGKDLPREQWIIIWIAIVTIGVFIAQSVVYYIIAKRQIPADRIENSLKSISDLRADGVNKLQNVDTSSIRTAEDLEKFRNQFLEWRDKVISEIKEVSPSQASIFQVLGLVKYRVSIKDYQGEVKEGLEKTLREIADYADRIKEFVDRFSVENLANRVKK